MGHQLPDIVQGSPAWLKARLGEDGAALPASEIKTSIQNVKWMIRTFPWYKGCWRYMHERRQLLEQQPITLGPIDPLTPNDPRRAMAHGSYYEKYAAAALNTLLPALFQQRDGPLLANVQSHLHTQFMSRAQWAPLLDRLPLQSAGIWVHDTLPWIRASPDLLTSDTTYGAELKCPSSSYNLDPANAIASYFTQIQQQLFLVGNCLGCFLFIYHVASQMVTLLYVFPRRERFQTELVPALTQFHRALLAPESYSYDYKKEIPFTPTLGHDYVPLITKAIMPDLFSDLPLAYDAQQEMETLWNSQNTFIIDISVPLKNFPSQSQ